MCNFSQRSITLSVSVLSCVVSNRLETSVHGPSPILVCFCPAMRSGMWVSRTVSASEGARCQRSEFWQSQFSLTLSASAARAVSARRSVCPHQEQCQMRVVNVPSPCQSCQDDVNVLWQSKFSLALSASAARAVSARRSVCAQREQCQMRISERRESSVRVHRCRHCVCQSLVCEASHLFGSLKIKLLCDLIKLIKVLYEINHVFEEPQNNPIGLLNQIT